MTTWHQNPQPVFGLARSPEEVRRALVRSMSVVAECSENEIQADRTFEELGIDSLAFSELLVDLEDALGEELPPELLDQIANEANITTVADAFRLLGCEAPA